MEGKIDEFVEDSKDIRKISAAQFENQLQDSWENLQQILSDYQNSKKIFSLNNTYFNGFLYFVMNFPYI